jgi:hypothetical protein
MPSLHVALPFLLGLWFFRERWRAPGVFMIAYSLLIGFEVVLSGEHYVADVAGAIALAAGLAFVFSRDYAALTRHILALGKFRDSPPSAVPEPALVTPALPSSRAQRERAQTLIEFALIVPVFFLFLFSIVDFGIAIDRRVTLQHAVREGARLGAVNSSTSDIQDHTADESQGIVETGDVTVCYIDKGGPASPGNVGDAVEVTAEFEYNFPILEEILGAFGVSPISIDMTPHGTARLEQTVTGATAC